jgi:hypothetical protein
MMRRALVAGAVLLAGIGILFLGLRIRASHQQSSGALTSATTSITPSPTDTHIPPAVIERLASPIPIPGYAPDGTPLEGEPPPADLQPTTSGLDAVNIAWNAIGPNIEPTAVNADFGTFEGVPNWFVTFLGLCLEAPGGVSGSTGPECGITQETVDIDDATGQVNETFWGNPTELAQRSPPVSPSASA